MSLLQKVNRDVRKQFGRMLGASLAARGIKHNYIAEKIGVSAVQMHRIIKGVNFPSDEALVVIANELGVTVHTLLSDVNLAENLGAYYIKGEVE